MQSEKTNQTTVAKSCEQIGIELYVPVEYFQTVHKRTKAIITRARALIPGYAFVKGVYDFEALEDCKGVMGIMSPGKGHPPCIIPDTDILALRIAEAELHRDFDAKQARQRFKSQKLTRSTMKEVYPYGKSFTVKPGHMLEGRQGKIEGHTGRKAIVTMVEMLGGMVRAEFTVDQIELQEAV